MAALAKHGVSKAHDQLVHTNSISPRRLRMKDAAKYLGTSDKHLRKLAHDGKLPFATVGDGPTAPWVFDIRDLDAFIERSKIRL